MTPIELDIDIYQGDRKEIIFRLQEQTYDELNEIWVDGAYVNLTGCTVRSQLRIAKADAAPAATFDCSIFNQADPNLVGTGMAVLLPSVTAGLTSDEYFWDLEIEVDPTNIETWFAGKARLTKQVTR